MLSPSGTTSCVVGSSSGIHAWHVDFYIRRMRIGKNESLYRYLVNVIPELIEDCVFKPHIDAVISIPQRAPKSAILRSESAIHLLERVKTLTNNGFLRVILLVFNNITFLALFLLSLMNGILFVIGCGVTKNSIQESLFYLMMGILINRHLLKDCSEEFNMLFAKLKQIDLSGGRRGR